jgi:hypothetical protein
VRRVPLLSLLRCKPKNQGRNSTICIRLENYSISKREPRLKHLRNDMYSSGDTIKYTYPRFLTIRLASPTSSSSEIVSAMNTSVCKFANCSGLVACHTPPASLLLHLSIEQHLFSFQEWYKVQVKNLFLIESRNILSRRNLLNKAQNALFF